MKGPNAIYGDMKGFIQVSMGNYIPIEDIHMILTYKSRRSVAMRKSYGANGKVLDLTKGKKAKSMILLKDSWYLVICGYGTDTLAARVSQWKFGK
jgi:regulator of extracellular matrix RemA (YlzA/DUF370 family)